MRRYYLVQLKSVVVNVILERFPASFDPFHEHTLSPHDRWAKDLLSTDSHENSENTDPTSKK